MEKAKRTYSTGCAFDLGDGKWLLRVSAGTGLGGKRLRPTKTITAKSKYEAERQLKKYIAEIDSLSNKEKMTLNALLDLFMAEKVAGLAPRTRVWYEDTLRRVRGALGSVLLSDLKPRNIGTFYMALADETAKPFYVNPETKRPLKNGLSSETILHHHRALSAALNWAYENELMDTRIEDRVHPPTTDTEEMRVLTIDEINRFTTALAKRSIRWQAFYTLALVTGMRREELCALEWKHIDTQAGTIRIEQATADVRGKNQLGNTKNRSSSRTIEISSETITLLKQWRAEQIQQRLKWYGAWEGDFVFTTFSGEPVKLGKASLTAKQILAEASIEGATLHSLRHTCITRLLAAGIPVPNVAAYVGHASAKMTLDVYGHKAEEYAASCATVMQSVIRIDK